jgi:hypothetical protein
MELKREWINTKHEKIGGCIETFTAGTYFCEAAEPTGEG